MALTRSAGEAAAIVRPTVRGSQQRVANNQETLAWRTVQTRVFPGFRSSKKVVTIVVEALLGVIFFNPDYDFNSVFDPDFDLQANARPTQCQP
ncbi:MAG TPA: hypothetical protein DDY14_17305 [Chromatiaceae bacterium]|jgi:hypothetical protein|nr:MAG: hypothetical protein N838_20625 [Thiohalocapsa sp. PB-PSB1]HBG97038.1 hypothetical protein [Chromatiaceae bacterium]